DMGVPCMDDGGLLVGPELTFSATTAGMSEQNPAAAFDGTNYLVVWQAGPATGAHYRLYGSRMTPAGQILDNPPILISDGPATAADVAFNGTDFVVVWEDFRALDYDIRGSRVSSAGLVRDQNGITIE